MSESRDTIVLDTIVLVHGFGANRLAMLPMARRFQSRGYRVVNLGYFSLASIERSSKVLTQRLRELDQQVDLGQLHIVAHSMGCILVRKSLLEFHPQHLGRVVMLTPPSKGSPRADLLAPALGWLIKPLQELTTTSDSLVNQLPNPNYRFSRIRATYDFLIPENYEYLPGAEDELVVQGIHSYVLFSAATMDQILHYLQTGRFEKPSEKRA